MSNSIFSNNSAGSDGAGIYNLEATLNAGNNVFYNNLDGGGSEDDCNGCTSNSSAIDANPMLAPLANYGGPMLTMIPLPGSGAICAGSSSLAAAGMTTDERGFAFDTHCPSGSIDSGAVQTSYALSFLVEPPSPLFVEEAMRPSPRVWLTENGNIATMATSTVSMTDSASVLDQTKTAGLSSGVAIFGDLTTSAPVSSDVLTATLALNPWLATPLNLTAQSSPFNAETPTAATFSPASGSTLGSASTTFSWTGGLGVEDYELLIGTTGAGSDNIYNSEDTHATQETVTVPAIGATVYVRFRQMMSGAWQQADYTYTESGAAVAATITTPADGSTLTGSSVTFLWTGGVGVQDYDLTIGTTEAGSANVYDSGVTQATSETVTVPAVGAPLYVMLRQRINGVWQESYYTYTEYGEPTAATITSPSNGSTLTGSSVTFVWTGGVGVQDYDLTVGTTGVGSYNVYDSGDTHATHETVTVPATGGKLYVRLRQRINGVWTNGDYVYTEQ